MTDEAVLPEDDSVFTDTSINVGEVSSDALLEDSFSSVVAGVGTSTPNKPSRRGRGTARGQTSSRRSGRVSVLSQPQPPVSTVKQRLPCPKCSNTYANDRTLSVHLKMHVMKGISSRAATQKELEEEMGNLMTVALEEMQNILALSDLGTDVDAYCALLKNSYNTNVHIFSDLFKFLSVHFYNILKNQNALFPSAVRSAVNVGVNKLLCDENFILEISAYLKAINDTLEEVFNIFIGILMLNISSQVTIFYMKKIRLLGNENLPVTQRKSTDDPSSTTFQQLVYHIGGSVVSGLMWKGEKYKDTSKRWNVFLKVMKDKFIQSEGGDSSCSESVRLFTESKDRGGLKYISQQAFDFFLTLFDLIMSLEGIDGSLPLDVIEDNVLKSDVLLCLWDVLVGDDLNEEQALDLFLQVCNCCRRVVVKGIMKRRLNEQLKKAYSSVTLRSRLAR